MHLIIAILALSLTSCALYRMPAPDEFSTVPVTNNPTVTHDPGDNLVPQINQ